MDESATFLRRQRIHRTRLNCRVDRGTILWAQGERERGTTQRRVDAQRAGDSTTDRTGSEETNITRKGETHPNPSHMRPKRGHKKSPYIRSRHAESRLLLSDRRAFSALFSLSLTDPNRFVIADASLRSLHSVSDNAAHCARPSEALSIISRHLLNFGCCRQDVAKRRIDRDRHGILG